MGWVVNVMPLPLYPRERAGTRCIGAWVWTSVKNFAPKGIRFPHRSARSESPYRLSYRGPHKVCKE